MADDTEARIRERAYALWQKEGGPDGRDAEFWERARLMLEAEAAPSAVPPPRSTSKGEAALDRAIEATFPASDPPAATESGTVR